MAHYTHGNNLQRIVLSDDRDFLPQQPLYGLGVQLHDKPILEILITQPNFFLVVKLHYISEEHMSIKLFRISQQT